MFPAMTLPLESTIFVISLTLALLAMRKYFDWRRIIASVPPGPRPRHFFSNTFDPTAPSPEEMYAEWGQKFDSDLVSVWALGKLSIVINTESAARELLARRAQNYSDRPRYAMFELQDWDWNPGFLPYGPKWRSRRRALHHVLHANAVRDFVPMQNAQVRKFVLKLYNHPEGFRQHIQLLTAGIAMAAAYAYEVGEENDAFAKTTEAATIMLSQAMLPGAAIVNALPILKYVPGWVPGASYQKEARKCRELTKKIRYEPLEWVQKNMAQGTATTSIVQKLLENKETADDTELVADVGAIIYTGNILAGSDTLMATIAALIMALSLTPDVQRRAWDELDTIVGRNRMPTSEDREAMPYIEAICQEIVRWHVVIRLGAAHKNVTEDVYNGMYIPAGTEIYYNAWEMSRDPTTYPEPELFKPERWLDDSGRLNGKEFDPAFGFGRRSCVGVHFAKSTLWLVAASMLAAFEFGKAQDEHGRDVEIKKEFTSGFLSHPKDFRCLIVPRDTKAREMLDELKSV